MLFSEVIVCVNTNGTVVESIAFLFTLFLYKVGTNSAFKLSVTIIVLYLSIVSFNEAFTKPCVAMSSLLITFQVLFCVALNCKLFAT